MTDGQTTAPELIATVERLSGRALRGEEGVAAGDPERAFDHAMLCWMPTPDALEAAERSGAQVVIPHEALYFCPMADSRIPGTFEAPWASWPANARRREIVERAGYTVVRFHGSADQICIYDAFAERLDLTETAAGEGCGRVFAIPPTPLRDLIERVKRAVGFEHLRVAAPGHDLDREVSRVGLPWGGMGLGVNLATSAGLIAKGADVLISGESDAGAFRFAVDSSVPVIETSHAASEIPGVERFAEILRREHPGVRFDHYDNGTCWRWA